MRYFYTFIIAIFFTGSASAAEKNQPPRKLNFEGGPVIEHCGTPRGTYEFLSNKMFTLEWFCPETGLTDNYYGTWKTKTVLEGSVTEIITNSKFNTDKNYQNTLEIKIETNQLIIDYGDDIETYNLVGLKHNKNKEVSFDNAGLQEPSETQIKDITANFSCFKKYLKKEGYHKPLILRDDIKLQNKRLKIHSKSINRKNWFLSPPNGKVKHVVLNFLTENQAEVSLFDKNDKKTSQTFPAFWEITDDDYMLLGVYEKFNLNSSETYALRLNLSSEDGLLGAYTTASNTRKCGDSFSTAFVQMDASVDFEIVSLLDIETNKQIKIGNALDAKIKEKRETAIDDFHRKTYEGKAHLFNVQLLDNVNNYQVVDSRLVKQQIRNNQGFPVEATYWFKSTFGVDLKFHESQITPPLVNKSFQEYKVVTITFEDNTLVSEVSATAQLQQKGMTYCNTFGGKVIAALRQKRNLVPAEEITFKSPNVNHAVTARLDYFCGKNGKHYASLDTNEVVDTFTIILKIHWTDDDIASFFSIKENISSSIDTDNF